METGRILILLGLALVIAGLVLQYLPGLTNWFGKLPGDIDIKGNGYRVFIPLASMILVSVILTLVINLFFRR